MVTGYLYRSNQEPVMEQDWYCGRVTGWNHASARLESPAEGEVISLHAGHGVFHKYRVEAADKKTALLVRISG